MLIKRVPEWYQDDSLVKTVNDEISFTEINSYYDYLRSYVEQPIQIWREVKSLEPLDAKIKIRLNADSAYPLREMNLYESCLGSEDDEVLLTKKYRRYDKITTDFIEYTNEPTLENCYIEVKYWCLSGSIAIGFPQDSNAADETFLPNTFLDKHAKTYGLFRRVYRDDITTEELPYTYPMGYPYSTEQDYFLEKRILEEYGNRLDKIGEVALHDTNNLKTVRLIPKIAGVHDIEIITHANKVDIIDNQKYNTIITESYTYTDSRTFEEDILRNSKILTAKVLSESSLPLTSESQWIRTEGTYQKWGLLESEINQYLGVIPKIKDMADYVLIWDRRNWNNYVWAGDDYSFGVFQVRIPYADIPANFNYLTMDEIQTIINKCKKLGTKGIPTYIYDSYLDISTIINSVDENVGVGIDLDLELNATTMDRTADLSLDLNPLILGSIENYGGTVNPYVLYPSHMNLPLSVSLNTTTMYNMVAKTLDTQTDWNSTINQRNFSLNFGYAVGDHTIKDSSGFIQIDEINDYLIGPYGIYYGSENTSAGQLSWSQATNTSQGGYCQTNSYGYTVPTDNLLMKSYIFNIPDDSEIVGIEVLTWAQHYGGAANLHCQLRTPKGIATERSFVVPNETTYASSPYTLGSNTDLWGISGLTPSDFNGGNSYLAYWYGSIPNNCNATVGPTKMQVHYKLRTGKFCTQTISAPTPASGYAGRWGNLSQTLTESLPSGCNVTYDVFQEFVDQQQSTSNGTDIFGTPSSNEEWCQIFNPSVSSLTGVSLWAMGTIGAPTDNVLVSICTLSNSNPGYVIQTTSIPAANWPANGEIKIPFDITGLNTSSTWYGIWLHRSGSLDSNNYYKFRIINSNAYSGGDCRYNYKGTWNIANSGNWDIYFKTWYPSNLLTGQTAPVNLRNIPYTDIKIRGNMTATDITKTPKIDKITITREEVAS